MSCKFCNKECEHNYCSWECQIEAAKASGLKEHLPNGLRITCITTTHLLECEHGDHPDYMFPVEVECAQPVETRENLPEWDTSYGNEIHALIYTDGNLAVTMSEATYYFWKVEDGSEWPNSKKYFFTTWRLTKESCDKIKDQFVLLLNINSEE